jgi:hypothetical protein
MTSTVQIIFPDGIGKPKLDETFANAEKWAEEDQDDDGWTVAHRAFVRHPRYPECTMLIEVTMTPMENAGPGVSRAKVKRVISDDGRTPISALSQIARYSAFISEFMQKRRGGPAPPPDVAKLKAIEGWYQAQGKMTKDAYARSIGYDSSTLRRWENQLRREGKL